MNKTLLGTLLVMTSLFTTGMPLHTTVAVAQPFNPTETAPQLEYRVGLPPDQIWDGTIEYFKEHGFTTVVLIAVDTNSYEKELQKIKQLGMYPILDLEHIIWNAGRQKSTPIRNFTSAFAVWQQAGWIHVATEGGRNGDLDVLRDYFPKFTFFNCDRCGLYKNLHKSSYTTEMSWETFFTSQIRSIKRGAVESYNLGKGQGILAGVWRANNECRDYETYKSLLDWSYQENVGFAHFHVFFGIGSTLANYKELDFETIVSELQRYYPPKPTPSLSPTVFITSVREVPTYPNCLVWDISNIGNDDVWVAPYATLYNQTAVLPGYASASKVVSQDVRSGAVAATADQRDGLGWAKVGANKGVTIISPAIIPTDAKWAVYNAYIDYHTSVQGRLFSDSPYTTVAGIKAAVSPFEVFISQMANVMSSFVVALGLTVCALVVILLLFKKMR